MDIKRLLKRPLSKLHGTYLKLYDKITQKTITISVGDIILSRDSIDHCQFLLSSRMLDAKRYVENDDATFNNRNTIARACWGVHHKEEIGNMHFKTLIESYKEKGYDPSSTILVDRDCRLIDGNHRMGTNLYFKIEDINVRMVKRLSNYAHNIDWYFRKKLSSNFINDVLKGYNDIQQWLIESGNTFCCLIRDKKFKDYILSDLRVLTNVLHVSEMPTSMGG